eukprot:TRINITY_DN4354_c0_g4_i1.p1 TRINITY_DN4354_c0_g4~~TRINITY_DN4354_c0_g4_i1.p1  ORF type:complete len:377 (+),score=53.93 TRINITY_DN4354_c0_g4_i1:49-1179(+)
MRRRVLITGKCKPKPLFNDGEIARYENEDGETIELLGCDDLKMLMDCFDMESGFEIEIDSDNAQDTKGTISRIKKDLKIRKLTTELHERPSLGMSFSNDRRRIVTTGKDCRTLLYDIQKENVRWSHKGKSPGLCTAYSPVEDHFLVGEEDSIIQLFDATNILKIKKKAAFKLSHPKGKVYGVDYFPSGGHFFTCGTFSRVLIFDICTGKRVVSEIVSDSVFAAKTVSAATAVYSPDYGNSIQMILSVDIRTNTKSLPSMKGHTLPIWSLDVSDSGNEILSAAIDGAANLFDIRTGKLLRNYNISKKAVRRALFIKEDIIATSGRDQTIRFWDTTSGGCVGAFDIQSDIRTDFQMNMCSSHDQLFCSTLKDVYHVTW